MNRGHENMTPHTLSVLFVYGTLRRQFGHQLHELIRTHFDWIGEGTMRGKLFDMGSFPAAVISKTGNDWIVGELYNARENDDVCKTLKVLDDYEGYDQDNPALSEFIRKRIYVRLRNGKKILSWVYAYNRPVVDQICIADGDYIAHVSKKNRL